MNRGEVSLKAATHDAARAISPVRRNAIVVLKVALSLPPKLHGGDDKLFGRGCSSSERYYGEVSTTDGTKCSQRVIKML